jgi:imidazolonepropionase-like amidohydrolase
VTGEQVVELRMSVLAPMHAAGVRFVSGTDGGIAPTQAHGSLAEAVVELSAVLATAKVLATATSRAAVVCGPAQAERTSRRSRASGP